MGGSWALSGIDLSGAGSQEGAQATEMTPGTMLQCGQKRLREALRRGEVVLGMMLWGNCCAVWMNQKFTLLYFNNPLFSNRGDHSHYKVPDCSVETRLCLSSVKNCPIMGVVAHAGCW